MVEDDLHTYYLVANVLEKSGYNLLHAKNAQVAFEAIMQQEPRLILLDLRLPGLDGWEFARQLKSHPVYSQIPIIAVTVQVDPEDEERALAAGVDQYMPKPFNIKNLRAVIGEYLGS
jgi:CheY-like chemotaxis protein